MALATADFKALNNEDASLARVLLKVKALNEEKFKKYVKFKKLHDKNGKRYLGEILVKLGFMTDADIKEFMQESNKQHLEFAHKLCRQGFLGREHLDEVAREYKENNADILTTLAEKKFMTRDTFSRLFNKQNPQLRLGEWLVFKKKVTQEQIDKAKKVQNIHGLGEYLVHHGYCSEKTISKVRDKITGG